MPTSVKTTTGNSVKTPTHTPQFLRAQKASREAWQKFRGSHARMLAETLADGQRLNDVKLLLPDWLPWTRWLADEGRAKPTADNHVRLFRQWAELEPLLTEAEAAEVRFGSAREMLAFLDRRNAEHAKAKAAAKRQAEEAARLAAMTPEERAAEAKRVADEEAERRREEAAEAERQRAQDADEAGRLAGSVDPSRAVAAPDYPGEVGSFTPEDDEVDDGMLAELLAAFEATVRSAGIDRITVPLGQPLSVKKVDRDIWVRVDR